MVVIGDAFSRFCLAVPVKDETAEKIAEAFMGVWSPICGPPKTFSVTAGMSL